MPCKNIGTNDKCCRKVALLRYFKGRNFRGKKLSRFRKTAKYLHFAGINFRGRRLMKNFAGINFRGEPLSKDFPGIKKGENLNL